MLTHAQHRLAIHPRRRDRMLADWTQELVEAHFGIPSGGLHDAAINDHGRVPTPMRLPRDLAAYLLVTLHGRSASETAKRFGCHRSTVALNVRAVEAERDDPVLDAHLSALERALTRLREVLA